MSSFQNHIYILLLLLQIYNFFLKWKGFGTKKWFHKACGEEKRHHTRGSNGVFVVWNYFRKNQPSDLYDQWDWRWWCCHIISISHFWHNNQVIFVEIDLLIKTIYRLPNEKALIFYNLSLNLVYFLLFLVFIHQG